MQNPSVQQFNLGVEQQAAAATVLRVDGVHNLGTHFIIGRTDRHGVQSRRRRTGRVVNLESSVNTKYDALLGQRRAAFAGALSASARRTRCRRRSTTPTTTRFRSPNGPIDPNNLQREYGPTPNDQRHRFSFAGVWSAPNGINVSAIWTMASGVPMDILMPDAQSRIPVIPAQRRRPAVQDAGRPERVHAAT